MGPHGRDLDSVPARVSATDATACGRCDPRHPGHQRTITKHPRTSPVEVAADAARFQGRRAPRLAADAWLRACQRATRRKQKGERPPVLLLPLARCAEETCDENCFGGCDNLGNVVWGGSPNCDCEYGCDCENLDPPKPPEACNIGCTSECDQCKGNCNTCNDGCIPWGCPFSCGLKCFTGCDDGCTTDCTGSCDANCNGWQVHPCVPTPPSRVPARACQPPARKGPEQAGSACD